MTASPRMIAPTVTPLMPSITPSKILSSDMPRMREVIIAASTERPKASKIIGEPASSQGTIEKPSSTPIGTRKSIMPGR